MPVAPGGCRPTVGAIEGGTGETGLPASVVDATGAHCLCMSGVLAQIDDPAAVVDGAVVRPFPGCPPTWRCPTPCPPCAGEMSHLALVTAPDGGVCAMVALRTWSEDVVGTVRDGMPHG